eukprot:CAMPEP_0170527940 /NCGR_PEP_ID=MMETSP0209-20121228/13432_1 /TAXON_ID=665100 ORGANISM="Litonotus pictus, Strain P1" /NCGR_SAMPLE_ID=MMETSP0209 /ASSEMBLY_ACC=CAM_ASM_000301 /LENGTH=724 /DNA_ID=CAMNT_0010818835 /DNA_START=105 /DNA_END=2279 /DNA_ORIENTATION=+
MKLDIEGMIRKNNIADLEPYLNDLIFGSVEQSDLNIASEEHVVKLVKMFQYSLEYLFFYQQKLENQLMQVQGNYNSLVNDAVSKENELKENKNLIQILKRDKKEKEMVISNYKVLIEEFRRKNGIYSGGASQNNNNIQTVKTRGYFECSFCTGKVFDSEENLNKHLARRHPSQKAPKEKEEVQKNNYDLNTSVVDQKISYLNKNFETYVKAITDPMLNYMSSQKNIETQIMEIKKDTQVSKLEMEGQVKTILLEIKDMYMNKTLMERNPSIEPQRKEENTKNIMYESEIAKLTDALKTMKSQLDQINNNQSKQQQALNLHSSQYMKDKEKEKENEKERINKFKELEKKQFAATNSSKQRLNFKQTAESQISIRSDPKNEEDLDKKEYVYKRKEFFNSGPLESDEEYMEEAVQEKRVNPGVFQGIVNKSIQKVEEKEQEKEKDKEVKIDEKVEEPPQEIPEEPAKEEKPVEIVEEKKEDIIEKDPRSESPSVIVGEGLHDGGIVKTKLVENKPVMNVKDNIPEEKAAVKKIQKPPVPVDPLQTKKEAYNKLANTFNVYMARDINFEETGKMDMYKSIIVPNKDPKSTTETQKDSKSKKSIDDKLNSLLNNESKRLSTKGFSELGKEENLPKLINSILSEMETVKNSDQYFSHYYDTANSLFKINDMARKASESKKKYEKSQAVVQHAKTQKKLDKINDENNLLTSKTKVDLTKTKRAANLIDDDF